jgi:hypothetical protein
MDQVSMDEEQLVVRLSRRQYLELPIEVYRAVLMLSSGIREDLSSSQLSIVAPTLQAARGIYQEVYAYISTTASPDQSSTES